MRKMADTSWIVGAHKSRIASRLSSWTTVTFPVCFLRRLTEYDAGFAVYLERPELINRSILIKVEGLIGDEEVTGGMRGREGWVLTISVPF